MGELETYATLYEYGTKIITDPKDGFAENKLVTCGPNQHRGL